MTKKTVAKRDANGNGEFVVSLLSFVFFHKLGQAIYESLSLSS